MDSGAKIFSKKPGVHPKSGPNGSDLGEYRFFFPKSGIHHNPNTLPYYYVQVWEDTLYRVFLLICLVSNYFFEQILFTVCILCVFVEVS